ncbi:DNA polymerase Y family protein [Povalibacter sp.]|uniref:Y-family DNA polymerase n=1 Tax=Povalibacter sp. TaxID=1962978 RepID=UPI002F3EEB44
MKAVPTSLPLPHIDLPQATRPPLRPVVVTQPPPPASHPEARKRHAWLAIHLTELPLAAALQVMKPEDRTSLLAQPLVLVDEDRFRSVLCCNDLAYAYGVRPGHRLNAAISLCAQVQCLPRAVAMEAQVLEAVAHHCQRFTPTVVIEPPNELVLEVRSSLKLFGGVQALIRAIESDLQQQQLAATIAISRTLRSAQWFARCARTPRIVAPNHQAKALAELPLAVLLWPEDVRQRLRRFGVTTVGELLRLPRGGLSRRIGHRWLRELDQAQGRDHDVRHTYTAPENYRDRILLDFEIETLTLAESVLSHRLQRLERFLRRRNATISELTITLYHRDLPPTPVRLGLAVPSADTQHLAKLLHDTLHGLTLPAPIREIVIEVPRWFGATTRTQALAFTPNAPRETGEVCAAQARLLEQLQARLGTDRIRTLGTSADRRPEHTQRHLPVRLDITTPPAPLAPLAPRPLWLLQEPKRLPCARGRPSGLFLEGIERIQNGWWDSLRTDRDYRRLRSASGAMGWVYLDHVQQEQWFLHGLFG